MMPCGDDVVRLANQLAASLCTQGGLDAFRLLLTLQHAASSAAAANTDADDPVADSAPVAPPSAGTVRVGIWERRGARAGTPFVRVQGAGDWHLWADVQEIRAKGAAPRVLLIGESVARGFFYEPFVTPALVLAAMLRRAAGREIEVIDLARSSLSSGDLLALTASAFALEPDALVVMAGNNWHPMDGLTPAQLREMGAIVRGGDGWRGLKRYLDERARDKARQVLAELRQLHAAHGVPIVVVIPEFNLADWEADSDEPPLLADADLALWLRGRDAAAQAIEAGRVDEAARHARTLVELDGGASAAGFRFQARALAAAGAAIPRALLEGARDAAICSGRRDTPRCYGPIQEVLRQHTATPGRTSITSGPTAVDLPKRFDEYLDGGLPGRRLFGDYCHFTIEGMRVAMASVAAALLPQLPPPPGQSRREPAWRDLLDTDLRVSDQLLAFGHVTAAVHNANWGNRAAIVADHLDRATALHAPIVNLVRLFLDFHIRRVAPGLCGAFEEMARTESPYLAPFFFRSTRVEKDINFGLIATMTEWLAARAPALADQARQLLVAEHDTAPRGRDLLHRAYTGLAIDQALDADRYAFYRATRRVSSFVFVTGEPGDTRVRLTLRTPAGKGEDDVAVRVNGVLVQRAEASPCWRRVELTIPRAQLAHGLNTLEIVWPESAWAYAHRSASVLDALEAGRRPESGAAFGEVHTLVASPVLAPPDRRGDQTAHANVLQGLAESACSDR